jgi:hypothetical protein
MVIHKLYIGIIEILKRNLSKLYPDKIQYFVFLNYDIYK